MAFDAILGRVGGASDEQMPLREMPTSSIGAGLGAGVAGLQQGYGALAGALGFDTADFVRRKKEEAEFYQRNAPGATHFFGDDGVTGDGKLLDWMAYNLGQSAPYMAEMLAGGLAGGAARGLATGAVRTLGKDAVLEGAARSLGTDTITAAAERAALQKAAENTAMRYSAGAGAAAASYPSAVGDILNNQMDAGGEYSLAPALAGGVPYALLNLLGGEGAILRAATGGLAREGGIEGAKGLVKRTLAGENLGGAMVRGGARAGVMEGVGETSQELINQVAGRMVANPNEGLFTGDAPMRYAESFMAGLGLGGPMGAASQVFAKPTEGTPEAIAQRKESLTRSLEQITTGNETWRETLERGRAEDEAYRKEQEADRKEREREQIKEMREAQKLLLTDKTNEFKDRELQLKEAAFLKEWGEQADATPTGQVETDWKKLFDLATQQRQGSLPTIDGNTTPAPIVPRGWDQLTLPGEIGYLYESPAEREARLALPVAAPREDIFSPEQRYMQLLDIIAGLKGLPASYDKAGSLRAAVEKKLAPTEEELRAIQAARDTPFEEGTLFNPGYRPAETLAASATPTAPPNRAERRAGLQAIYERNKAIEAEAMRRGDVIAASNAALDAEETQKALQEELAWQESNADPRFGMVQDMFGRSPDFPAAPQEAAKNPTTEANDFVTEGLRIGFELQDAEKQGDTATADVLRSDAMRLMEQLAQGLGKKEGTAEEMFQNREEDAAPRATTAGKAASGNMFKQPAPTKGEARANQTTQTQQAESPEAPQGAVETLLTPAPEKKKPVSALAQAFGLTEEDVAQAKADAEAAITEADKQKARLDALAASRKKKKEKTNDQPSETAAADETPAPVETAEADEAVAAVDATEDAEEVAAAARESRAEAEVDAGPIGEAIRKLEDGDDLTKRQIKAYARKLEKEGVIDDAELDDEGRDTDVSDLLQELQSRVEDARDAAIQERVDELEAEQAEEPAPAARPDEPYREDEVLPELTAPWNTRVENRNRTEQLAAKGDEARIAREWNEQYGDKFQYPQLDRDLQILIKRAIEAVEVNKATRRTQNKMSVELADRIELMQEIRNREETQTTTPEPEATPEAAPAATQEVTADERLARLNESWEQAVDEGDFARAETYQKLIIKAEKDVEKAGGLREQAGMTRKEVDAEAAVGDEEYVEPARFGKGEVGELANDETDAFPQDYANGTPQTVPRIQTALATAETGEDLVRIVEQEGSPMEKRLARLLRSIGVDKLTVLYEDRVNNEDGKRVLGQHFDAEVRIFRGGENTRTLLHELFHGVTVAQLERARRLMQMSEKELAALRAGSENIDRIVSGRERLIALMEETNAKAGTAFTDVMEFVSEVMSDPELQHTLMNTRSEQTPLAPSLWVKVAQAIRSLFEAALAQINAVRDGSAVPFDASVFARVMEATATVSEAGYKGKAFNQVTSDSAVSNVVTNAMGNPTPGNPMRPSPNSKTTIDAIADSTLGLRGKEYVRQGMSTLRNGLEWLNTQRGLAMKHPTYRAIQDHVSRMINDKENILTYLNEAMQRFHAENKDPVTQKMIGDMLRSSTLMVNDELSDDMASKIVAAVHEHMLGTGKRIYTINDETGEPELSKHIRDLGVVLPKSEFVKGVQIENSGELIKFADDQTLEKAYAGYQSAMDALILGHVYRLAGAEARATAMNAREIAGFGRDYGTTVVDALQKLRDKYDNKYRELSSIDVKKRRVMQKDSTVDASLERVAEILQGLLAGNEMLTDVNGKIAPQAEIVRSMLGISQQQLTDMLAPLQAEAAKAPKGKKRNDVASKFRDQIIAGAGSTKLIESEALSAMQSLMTMYVPLRRYGKYMMHLRLIDEKGNNVTGQVTMPDGSTKDSEVVLDLWQHDNLTALQTLQKGLNEQLASDPYVDVKVGDEIVKAKLAWDLPVRVNEFRMSSMRVRPAEFYNAAEAIGITLTPDQKARVLKASTNADAAARGRSLERKGIPGYSHDFVRAISDHLGSVASLVAIRKHEETMHELASGAGNWAWDEKRQKEEWDRVEAARKAFEAAPANAKKRLGEEYNQLAFEYRQVMNGMLRDPKMSEIQQQARLLVEYVLGGDQLEEAESFTNKVRAVTTIMQLGGTIASAFTNLSSLPLHTFSYLATYNAARGFGGGFGGVAASSAIKRAAIAMGPLLAKSAGQITGKIFLPELEFRRLEELARKSPDGKHGGYSVAHWEYLRKASAEGILAAQRYNELLAQRKHSQFGPKMSKAISQYMSIFSATEEYNRMVTGLATFDLYLNQYVSEGMVDKDGKPTAEARDKAYEQSRKAVFATQGEYNMGNRPRLFRSDLGSLVGLYKTFIVTTLELLRNLPPKGQAIFLGSLYTMSGAGGIPLWEELMLVMDVAAQKTGIGLGITKGNAERAFADWTKDVGRAMGWEKLDEVMLRGVMDTYLGTEIFGRAGLSVGVPMLGMLRPGADFMEEVGRTLGAVGGATEGAFKAAGKLSRGDIEGTLRAVPITGVKNFADAYAYSKYDAVMNKRGQVVTQDPDAFDIFARTLGFYPEELKQVNDQVRREEYTRAYAKELKAAFIEEYREAHVLRDAGKKQEVREMVREHNQLFRGTALEILNFSESAEKSGKDAALPLRERAQKTLSQAQQRDSALR